MKAIKIISISSLLFIAVNAYSAVHVINQTDMTFSPSSLTVNVGDVVRWVWSSGTHTTSSRTIPAGALAWDNPLTSSVTSFEYTVTIAGNYSYACTIHESMGMVGGFTAVPASTGINESSLSKEISLYPNPASSFINIKTELNGDVLLSDVLGRTIKQNQLVELASSDNSYRLELSDLVDGIYIISILPSNGKKRISLKFIKN